MNETNKYYNKHKRNKDSETFYKSTEWQKTRQLALMRDRYLCVRCFKDKRIKKADLVHHIVEYKDDPTLGLTLSNLESICHAHHNGIHKVSSAESKIKVSNKINLVVSKPNPEIFWKKGDCIINTYINHLNKCIDECENEINLCEYTLQKCLLSFNNSKDLKDTLIQRKKELKELKKLKEIHFQKSEQ